MISGIKISTKPVDFGPCHSTYKQRDVIVPNILLSPAKTRVELAAVVAPFAVENRRQRMTRTSCPFGTDLAAHAREAEHRRQFRRPVSSGSHDHLPAAEQGSRYQLDSLEEGVLPQVNIPARAAEQHLDTNGNPLLPFDD